MHLHPTRRLGAAYVYPTYPGERRVRMFEYDESGIVRVSPDMPTSLAKPSLYPVGRRLMFGVHDPIDPQGPQSLRQVDWIDDDVRYTTRDDLAVHLARFLSFTAISDNEVVILGDAHGADVLKHYVALLLVDDQIVGRTTVPRNGAALRYQVLRLGGRTVVFWDTRDSAPDGGTQLNLWAQELAFEPIAGKDGG